MHIEDKGPVRETLRPERNQNLGSKNHSLSLPEDFSHIEDEYPPMAESWKEAKEWAAREGLTIVFHDCDTNCYGACRQGERQGSFKEGVFFEHRCICMPAHMSDEELFQKEKKFLSENPEW
jgi:hypothetical protein